MHDYQAMNAGSIWNLQGMFRDDVAGALSFDTDGDGSRDSGAAGSEAEPRWQKRRLKPTRKGAPHP